MNLVPIRDLGPQTPQSDRRKELGLCLRAAFPVGDAGSFTSLLQALGESTPRQRR